MNHRQQAVRQRTTFIQGAPSKTNWEFDELLAGFGPQAKFIKQIFLHDPRPNDDGSALRNLRVLMDDMLKTGNRATDPMREVFARLGDKWSALLLILLELRPMRFSTLNQLVDTISEEGAISRRILTLSLRALEYDGFIARDDRSGKRLYVSYRLTPMGRDFVETFRQLLVWTRAHLGEIRKAREQYCERYQPQNDNRGKRSVRLGTTQNGQRSSELQ